MLMPQFFSVWKHGVAQPIGHKAQRQNINQGNDFVGHNGVSGVSIRSLLTVNSLNDVSRLYDVSRLSGLVVTTWFVDMVGCMTRLARVIS